VTGQETTSEGADDDSIRLWHMSLGHTGEESLQVLPRQGLLKGVKTYKLDFCEHCVIGKKMKLIFDTVIYHTKGFLIMFTQIIRDLPRLHHLEVITTLSLLIIILGVVGCTPYNIRIKF